MTCEVCKKEFQSDWSEDEANREAEELFGVKQASTRPDMAVVCDECFMKMKPYIPTKN